MFAHRLRPVFRTMSMAQQLRARLHSVQAGASGIPSTPPNQQLLTLREIDQLFTSIERSSSASASHPSPLAMRSYVVPWLSSSSPNLDMGQKQGQNSSSAAPQMTQTELEVMLTPKHMSESYTSFDLPLASDPELLDKYVNASGGLRMGKLLEHLDSLAGAVAYRHVLPPPPRLYDPTPLAQTKAFHEASSRAGLYLATASADRLDMFGQLSRANVRDLKFSGFVTWTGTSSMEVVIKLQGAEPGTTSKSSSTSSASGPVRQWETLMLGRFAMVCRDSKTHKARKVPPLVVETDEERILRDIAAEHQQRRKERGLVALDKVPPSSDEAKELHSLMMQVVERNVDTIDGEKVVRMEDTQMESVQLMFPQDRNFHGKVFGGILMRLAFELCFTNAALFAAQPLRFLSLDQINFRLPVPIGAVLRLTSKIVHTTLPHEGPDGDAKVHIMVRAEVEEVETGIRKETNTFFFTLAREDGKPLGRTIVPETYSEAMHYLEGKRRLQIGDEMRRLYHVESE